MQDVKRVAFVTEHFLELQGLIPAIFGGAMLFGVLALQFLDPSGRPGVALQTPMLGMMIAGWSTPYLQASYRRTFGDAVATMEQKFRATLPTLLVLVGVVIDISGQGERPRSGPSFAAIALASYATWVVLRDWRSRAHHLIGLSAGLAGAIVTAAVPAGAEAFAPEPARANVFVLAYALIGVGLLAGGLGDHYLLTRCLGRSPEGATASPGTFAWVGLRRAWPGFCAAVAAAVSLSLAAAHAGAFFLTFLLALLASALVPAIVDAFFAVRDFDRRQLAVPDKGNILHVGTPEIAAAAAIALATMIHIALLWPSRPVLPAIAVAITSLALAISSPYKRTSRVVRAGAVAIVLAFFSTLSPARAFVALVGALAIAVVVEGLLEVRVPPRPEVTHARA
jgi:hypothetical protein